MNGRKKLEDERKGSEGLGCLALVVEEETLQKRSGGGTKGLWRWIMQREQCRGVSAGG